MSVFRLYIQDPFTGQETVPEDLPQVFDVITNRVFRVDRPNVIEITTEPLSEYLDRMRVDAWSLRRSKLGIGAPAMLTEFGASAATKAMFVSVG